MRTHNSQSPFISERAICKATMIILCVWKENKMNATSNEGRRKENIKEKKRGRRYKKNSGPIFEKVNQRDKKKQID